MKFTDRLSAEEGRASRTPWGVYFFLLIIFYFAQPFNLKTSAQYNASLSNTLEEGIAKHETGRWERRGSVLVLAVFALYLFQKNRYSRQPMNGVMRILFLAFILIVSMSVLWSQDVPLTVRKVSVFLLLCIGALAFAYEFSWENVAKFAVFCGISTIFIGLPAEIMLGTFRPWESGYMFRGVMHGSFQGWNTGMMLLGCNYMLFTRKDKRIQYGILFAVAALFLIMTKSRTATWGAFLTLIVSWGFLVPGKRKILLILTGMTVFSLAAFIMGDNLADQGRNLFFMGRVSPQNLTLTGRVDIWEQCMSFIRERPLFGYGYKSFWVEKYLTEFFFQQDWAVPDAHNGYVDLILGIGYVGLGAFLTILTVSITRSFLFFKRFNEPGYIFAGATIIYLLLNMVTVSTQLDPYLSSFATMILMAKVSLVPEEWEEDEYIDEGFESLS